jgi:hypothetical protein
VGRDRDPDLNPVGLTNRVVALVPGGTSTFREFSKRQNDRSLTTHFHVPGIPERWK